MTPLRFAITSPHLDVKRTYTSKLSFMHGVQLAPQPRRGGREIWCVRREILPDMAHTYCSSLFHCAFSTKERRKFITDGVQERLWAYLGGIARNHEMKPLAVGGAEDHVHILLSLPATKTIAQAMREIKQGSSRWMHETCGMTDFAWQEGYGAFSFGSNQVEATIAYIAGQREHHRKRDFQSEFVAFLKKNGIEYDPRFVWG